ncbi:MAG: outer membrane protein assembly factor BamB [Gammaproteobacteria bacterium]|nr:outer membrane protein assembly factor BamB [Gammaproteobacteria bacterium]MCH9763562.1 outer membrane protein assembly factor BamB [Gammaproteobacteria bacterium]
MARWLVLFFLVGLQSCSTIDDYWLGKDNSPIPGLLAPITSKATWTPCWTVALDKTKAKETYLHLKPALDGQVIYAATSGGMLKAIHQKTGRVQWSKQLNERLVSGPSAQFGRLVLATDKASILVLNQSDGHLLWKARLSGDVLSKPLIMNNRIVVKTVDGHLYAFDSASGTKLWVVDHGTSSLVLKASSSPVRYKNLVLAGFSDGKLDAIELETGRLVWQRSVAYASGSSDVEKLVDISSTPIVREDVSYLASYQGYTVAMSLRQGDFIWSKPVSTYKNLGIDSSVLYLVDNEDIIWSLGRRDGQVLWKQSALKARGVTAPALMGQHMIVGDKKGDLHVLDAKHGDFIARHSLGSAITVEPLVDSNHIYVMTASGQLHCFSVRFS